MLKEEFMDDSFTKLKYAKRLLPICALTAFIVERHNVIQKPRRNYGGEKMLPSFSEKQRDSAWFWSRDGSREWLKSPAHLIT